VADGITEEWDLRLNIDNWMGYFRITMKMTRWRYLKQDILNLNDCGQEDRSDT
jgi:hypothetical protein